MTSEVFRRYLDPAFRYAVSRNPSRVRGREDALAGGLNCVALAHLVLRDLFGYALPARMQAFELVRDTGYFEPVPDPDGMRAGDLVWFGISRPPVPPEEFLPRYDGDELANFRDFPVKHVAIATGSGDGPDHLLLHASSVDGTNALWPLRRFRDHDRYRRIYAIRRLRPEFRISGTTASSAGAARTGRQAARGIRPIS